MPDSAVNATSRATEPQASDSDQPASERGSQLFPSTAEAENKLARAARSAQRLARLSQMPRGAETLDLFAEDTERILLQATNTDLRQGTLAGFELPGAFMATLCATSGGDDPESAPRPARDSLEFAQQASVQIDLPVDDLPESATAEPSQHDADLWPKLDDSEPAPGGVAKPEAERASNPIGPRPAQPAAASVSNAARNISMPKNAAASEPGSTTSPSHSSLAASLVGTERPRAAGRDARPELDCARATAFADTIDALSAVIAEQRQAGVRLSRQMRTLQVFIVCVLAATLLAGVAQTPAFQRMSRENTLQQQRIEEMLLSQQATLASFFDTDSANVAVPNPDAAAGDTSKKRAARHAGKVH